MSDVPAADALTALIEEIRRVAAARPAERILDELSSGTVIYGAGRFGRQVAGLMADRGIELHGFIDRRGQAAGPVAGLPVIHPDDFTAERARDCTLAVAVFNPDVDEDEIRSFARSRPFRHVVQHADLPEALGPGASTLFLGSRTLLVESAAAIRAAHAILADEASRALFRDLLWCRATAERRYLPQVDILNQYLPPDLPGLSGPVTFVDGGAFDGDTYRFLTVRGVDIDRWVAFEPDPGSFAALIAAARTAGCPAILMPCGLSDRWHQVAFEATSGWGSRIVGSASAGSVTVGCVALDEILPGIAPDFIKLDVEGAEAAALRGMAATIRRHRPRLAVSAYHRPEDLWAIPLQLAGLVPEASIHLRQHTGFGTETVVYAIPGT